MAKTTKRGRGRPPTGCPKWDPEAKVWLARIKIPSGGGRPGPMPGIAQHQTERAHPKAKEVAEGAIAGGYVPAEALETVNDWFKRYYGYAERGDVGRKNRGLPQVTAKDRAARFWKWISPAIGTRPMALADASDLRAVVRKLDEEIRVRLRNYDEHPEWKGEGRRPGLEPKAAKNIYGELTSGFKEACSSKIETLLVRTDNPTTALSPPLGGGEREQTALYPSELLALLDGPAPLYRKIVCAVAAYTGMRAGELRNLTTDSIDFEHGVLNVRRQMRADGKVGRTKTRAGRRQIPIEPSLDPLLRALVESVGEGESLLRVPPAEDCAEKVRDD